MWTILQHFFAEQNKTEQDKTKTGLEKKKRLENNKTKFTNNLPFISKMASIGAFAPDKPFHNS